MSELEKLARIVEEVANPDDYGELGEDNAQAIVRAILTALREQPDPAPYVLEHQGYITMSQIFQARIDYILSGGS